MQICMHTHIHVHIHIHIHLHLHIHLHTHIHLHIHIHVQLQGRCRHLFETWPLLVEVTSGQLSALQLNLSTFCEQEAHVRDPVLPFALCVGTLDL